MTPPASIPIVIKVEPEGAARLLAERDRARCLAAALEQIASEAFSLLWETVGVVPSSHAAERDLGRRVAAFLRENAADAGPDRLPVPQGWEAST